jgi:prepilin-type processing-associated H-X9-DG protein
MSYAMNSNVANVAQAKISSPAKTVLLSEVTGLQVDIANINDTSSFMSAIDNGSYLSTANPFGGWGCQSRWPALQYQTGAYRDDPHNAYGTNQNGTVRHTTGANFLFSDGHVKWLQGAAVMGDAAFATCDSTANVAACYQIQ